MGQGKIVRQQRKPALRGGILQVIFFIDNAIEIRNMGRVKIISLLHSLPMMGTGKMTYGMVRVRLILKMGKFCMKVIGGMTLRMDRGAFMGRGQRL